MDSRSRTIAKKGLREEFVSVFSAATIDEALQQSTDEIAEHARVDNFVPLLAERRARERLTALARTRV